MITVRISTREDLDWLLDECASFSKFYNSKVSLMGSIEYATSFIINLIDNHYILISETDGVRSGFIAGLVTPHHFNPAIRVLSEIFWWVREEYRGGRSGSMLLNEFIKYGEANCDWILFTLEDVTPIGDESLIKRGFRLKERAFLREVN